jgi:hypothetical protein
VIDRSVFEPLYGEHLDPRDPTGKTRLGRAAQQFTAEETIFKELAAAEPHASPARLAELRTLAKAQTRHAVPFWDATVSVSKSITLFYGGLLAAAEQARNSCQHFQYRPVSLLGHAQLPQHERILDAFSAFGAWILAFHRVTGRCSARGCREISAPSQVTRKWVSST